MPVSTLLTTLPALKQFPRNIVFFAPHLAPRLYAQNLGSTRGACLPPDNSVVRTSAHFSLLLAMYRISLPPSHSIGRARTAGTDSYHLHGSKQNSRNEQEGIVGSRKRARAGQQNRLRLVRSAALCQHIARQSALRLPHIIPAANACVFQSTQTAARTLAAPCGERGNASKATVYDINIYADREPGG